MIVFFDSPEHLHNIAHNFRTMELLGFKEAYIRDRHHLFLREQTKGWLRKANKLSAGAIHRLKLHILDEAAGIDFLQKYQAGRVIATDFSPTALSMEEFKFHSGDCLVIGSEGGGFQEIISQLCPHSVYIPTQGQTQSFNVSVALGILLYKASGDLQSVI